MFCAVCQKEVSGMHQCQICKKYVHAICGVPIDGEEGCGKPVNCNNCLKGRKLKITNDSENYAYGGIFSVDVIHH